MVKCLECNKEASVVSWTHIKKCSGLSMKEYRKKWPNAEFQSKELKEKSRVTLELQIKKHGIEEGTKRWDEYCKKQAHTNSFEYKNEKYNMSLDEFTSYNKSRSSTLSNMIKRHGEILGKEKWTQYCNRQKDAGCSLNYFQSMLGNELGEIKYKELNLSKGHSIESYVKKYGEIEGESAYVEFWDSFNKSGVKYSKISQQLFNNILNKIQLTESIYFGSYNKEFGKYDHINKQYYFYDFVIPSLLFAIEFNGDLYHANPKKYTPTEIPKFRGNKLTAVEIWNKDRIKQNLLRDAGYNIIVIWESDYKLNSGEIEDKVCNLILQKLNTVQ